MFNFFKKHKKDEIDLFFDDIKKRQEKAINEINKSIDYYNNNIDDKSFKIEKIK